MKIERTIVEIDMGAYSTIASVLEESLGPNATFELNEIVRQFVTLSLPEVDASEDARLLMTTGDGAILSFQTPAGAHRFLESFHSKARKQNESKSEPTAMRVFRSGVAYGEVVMEIDGDEVSKFAGTTISKAVRLEAAADLGGVLIDRESFCRLPEEIQARYDGPEQIRGKRKEIFSAYRCLFDSSAAKKIDALTISPEDKSDSGPASSSAEPYFDSSSPSDRLDFLDQMELLCKIPGLLKKLVTGIGIPHSERPSQNLSCLDQCPEIFDWAEVKRKLKILFQSVQRLIIRHGLI